ncbi:hypothetical protein BDW60DRAFT_179838 [Aspergillus nidulans var. acristatus]
MTKESLLSAFARRLCCHDPSRPRDVPQYLVVTVMPRNRAARSYKPPIPRAYLLIVCASKGKSVDAQGMTRRGVDCGSLLRSWVRIMLRTSRGSIMKGYSYAVLCRAGSASQGSRVVLILLLALAAL